MRRATTMQACAWEGSFGCRPIMQAKGRAEAVAALRSREPQSGGAGAGTHTGGSPNSGLPTSSSCGTYFDL